MNNNINNKNHRLPILNFSTESGSNEVHYPAVYDSLPEEFKIELVEVLKETEEKRLKGLQILKDHINKKKLPNVPDYLLLAQLRVCKYDMKKARTKIETFSNKRKEVIDMLAETGLRKMELVLDNFSVGVLPYRARDGSFILFTRPDGFEFDLHSVENVGVVFLVILLFMLQFPLTTVTGLTYFPDCSLPSISYVYPILKSFRRLMWFGFSTPIRILKVCILNPVAASHWFFNLSKRLLSEKLTKRVTFYPKGYDMLAEEYHKNILPEEFGGNAGALDNRHFKEELLDFARKLIDGYR